MHIPNWYTAFPLHFGTTSGGSIKADQWRALITLYIPLVLTSQWPQVGLTDSSIWLKMTMDLMTAIYSCTSHTVSSESIKIYTESMLSYLALLKETFDKISWVPNYHAALHIPELLSAYGPPYGWWTFPFERLIKELQNVPVNARMGKIP